MLYFDDLQSSRIARTYWKVFLGDISPTTQVLEDYFVNAGEERAFAHFFARLVVGVARRRIEESRREREVFDALKFLSGRPRQKRAIVSRARILTSSTAETLIESSFWDAGLDEQEFFSLLKAVMDGMGCRDCSNRITEIAKELLSSLSPHRGPKMRLQSVTLTLIETHERMWPMKHPRARGRGRAPLLAGTIERAYAGGRFDPRPVRRRQSATRLLRTSATSNH